MLTDERRRRLEELSRAMNERSLTPEESAELGNLMALDMGASREPYQPPELRPRCAAPVALRRAAAARAESRKAVRAAGRVVALRAPRPARRWVLARAQAAGPGAASGSGRDVPWR